MAGGHYHSRDFGHRIDDDDLCLGVSGADHTGIDPGSYHDCCNRGDDRCPGMCCPDNCCRIDMKVDARLCGLGSWRRALDDSAVKNLPVCCPICQGGHRGTDHRRTSLSGRRR